MNLLRKIKKIVYDFRRLLYTLIGLLFYKKTIISEFIIMVDGGFGSQLNKYFVGLFLEKRFNVNVKYDITWFDKNPKSIDGKDSRKFTLLDVYPNIKFDIATDKEIVFYRKYFYCFNRDTFSFPPVFLKKDPPLYVDGYINNYHFFEPIMKEIQNLKFAPKLSEQNHKYLEQINASQNSVAVHVRRGDFLSAAATLNILEGKYFIDAIRKMRDLTKDENLTVFFFSNGFDWVRDNIIPYLGNINYELVDVNDNDDGYFDFYLITQCKHQITSNSSFGYLGAFVNNNPSKIVVIPENWRNPQRKELAYQNKAFYFPSFIRL